MADKSNDPITMWQNMLGEMGKGLNAFAHEAMASPGLAKAGGDQVGGLSADAQKQFGDMMEKYLVNLNLPSRTQMADMADRLQSIETQLDEIRTLLLQGRDSPGLSERGGRAVPKAPRARTPPVPPAEKE